MLAPAQAVAGKLSLADADGQLVLVQTKPDPAEPEPLIVGHPFCTGIPPGATPGTPLDYVYTWDFRPRPTTPAEQSLPAAV